MIMKRIFALLGCLIPLFTIAQTKVAVYVTATEKVPVETRKIIGSEMVAAFVNTETYRAIERTTEFLGGIAKEQDYQRTGSVDDNQICELGKQFGVDMVCVADVTNIKNQYYIQARLIDVEKAIVLATAREISDLADIDVILKVSQSLATKMTESEVTYSLTIENTHNCVLEVYIGDEVIGQVAKQSSHTFAISMNKVGRVVAKEKRVLFAKKYEKELPKHKALDQITLQF